MTFTQVSLSVDSSSWVSMVCGRGSSPLLSMCCPVLCELAWFGLAAWALDYHEERLSKCPPLLCSGWNFAVRRLVVYAAQLQSRQVSVLLWRGGQWADARSRGEHTCCPSVACITVLGRQDVGPKHNVTLMCSQQAHRATGSDSPQEVLQAGDWQE
jgi:hypothetical protein